MTEHDLDIAATIGRFRKEFGLTKTAVAQALGLKPTSYELERGNRTNNPGVKSIYKLALAFGVSTDYLLGLTDDPTPHWSHEATAPELPSEAAAAPAREMTPAEIASRFEKMQAQIDALTARLDAAKI